MKPERNEHSECERLDDFLSGQLSGAGEVPFTMHLGECSECRIAVAQQQWIDNLLCSHADVANEAPSPEMLGDIRAAIHKSNLRASVLTGGLAAAVLLLAAGLVALDRRETSSVGRSVPADNVQPIASAATHATVVGGPDTLVVPVESRWPDITIVRVYSATHLGVDGGSP